MLTLASSCFSPSRATTVTNFGAGLLSCASWEPNRELDISGWILGYWTGLNELGGGDGNHHQVGNSTDVKGILGEVKLFCRNNPSVSISDAIYNVYSRLRNQNR
jgi:hypothetical protein